MVSNSAIRYSGAYLFILIGWFSITSSGIWTFSLVIFSFVFIPIVELVLPPNVAINNPKISVWYDLILYSLVVFYTGLLVYFLSVIGRTDGITSLIGKISAMGLIHGIFGINMAHELGHRKSKLDQLLAQYLLLTSQYAHFFIEHNRGHHKRVATPEDPATARKGENLYTFWIRTVIDSYRSALELERNRLTRKGKSVYSWDNDMVKYAILQVVILVVILLFTNWITLLSYIAACVFGILLLETINYIEHYGLLRKKISKTAYERVQHSHSWNSDHLLGRYLLFELTRHSHHHENSTIKYPHLQSKENSPQLPTGYPGMMLLAFVPPLFFRVMNPRLKD